MPLSLSLLTHMWAGKGEVIQMTLAKFKLSYSHLISINVEGL